MVTLQQSSNAREGVTQGMGENTDGAGQGVTGAET